MITPIKILDWIMSTLGPIASLRSGSCGVTWTLHWKLQRQILEHLCSCYDKDDENKRKPWYQWKELLISRLNAAWHTGIVDRTCCKNKEKQDTMKVLTPFTHIGNPDPLFSASIQNRFIQFDVNLVYNDTLLEWQSAKSCMNWSLPSTDTGYFAFDDILSSEAEGSSRSSVW